MSDFRFGLNDHGLSYYPSDAFDGMSVDWEKVESVEIDWVSFVRERECEMEWTGRYCPPGFMVPQDMVQTCSACHGLGNDSSNPFHPEDPNEPIQFTNVPKYMRYCPLCGAKIRKEVKR